MRPGKPLDPADLQLIDEAWSLDVLWSQISVANMENGDRGTIFGEG